jgi:3-dehydroquinate dehydratase/shikimate dehydrogenase
MRPDTDATPLPKEYIKKDTTVFDTVYNPPQTLFLKQAKQKKAKTIDGLSMFVNQAAAQFRLFTNKDANTKLMRKTVSNSLSRR